MRTTEELFEEFHTEIMVQTSRGCPGANFTEANKIWHEFQSAQHSVQRTALQVRILNAICYGITAGSLLWLLFGSR